MKAIDTALIGKRVNALLDDENDVYVTGKLLEVWDDGGIVIEKDDGMPLYCWPGLSAEEVSEDPAEQECPSHPGKYGDH